MDNFSRKSTEEQKLQHSGDLGLEQPQVHYDKTPLPQAFEQHLTDTQGNVIVPDTIESVGGSEKKKSRKGLMIGLGGGAAALALAAGAVFGVNAMNQPPQSEPVPTAPADPGEQPIESPAPVESEAPGAEVEPVLTSYEIPVTTSPEDLGEAYTDILSAWSMSGSENPSLQDDMLLAMAKGEAPSYYDYYLPYAQENSKAIANDLFVTGWENDTTLTQWIDINTKINAAGIETWAQTYNSGNSEDVEPYKHWVTTESTEVVANTADGISIKSNITEHANIDKNRSAQLDPELNRINGNTLTLYATFVADGDTYKIKSINIVPRQ